MNKHFDVIVGIPRSGLMVACIIALYLNKPVTDLDSFLDGKILEYGSTKSTDGFVSSYSEIKRVLIVDDSTFSGNSITLAKKKVLNSQYSGECVFFAAYVTDTSKDNVDLYFSCINKRIFEWNYLQSYQLKYFCCDIDGVLCVDPKDEENDDGEAYVAFLRNAMPKLIPSAKVGYLVTCRLEKYRQYTEEWLQKHGVSYGKLIMLNLETAEQRRQLNNHSEFKAQTYKSLSDCSFFIESSPIQARKINYLSGKPVFCIENSIVYSESKMKANPSCSESDPTKQKILRITHKGFLKKICHQFKKRINYK